jgi:hypothetical protein
MGANASGQQMHTARARNGRWMQNGVCRASPPRTYEGAPPLLLLSIPSLVFCYLILPCFAQLLLLLISFTLLNLDYIYIPMCLLSHVYLCSFMACIYSW